jgi:RNA polymerase sigma-70 factor (ECF subfamily)
MELAFIVALQKLPPLQRAVLLLREVVGFSAAETADQLGASVASVNSALQRARAAVRGGLPGSSQQETLRELGDQRTRAIVEKYMDAMERGDADMLVGMLTEDATWCMPPIPTWFAGHDLLREFLLRYPLSERWKHLPTQANGQLAVGCYLFDTGTGRYRPAAMDVLTLEGDKIRSVVGFLTAAHADTSETTAWAASAEMFARYDLPTELP